MKNISPNMPKIQWLDFSLLCMGLLKCIEELCIEESVRDMTQPIINSV